MSRILRRLFLVLALLGTALLTGWALRPRPIQVVAVPVVRGALTVHVEEEGQTRMRHRYVVTAPVRGRLLRIDLEVGDAVEPATTVARIDPLVHESALAEAEASVAEWRAQIQGVDTLRPKEEALREARLRIEVARESLAEARADVSRAEAAHEAARIEARRTETLSEKKVLSEREYVEAQATERVRAEELAAARHRADVADLQIKVAEAAAAAFAREERDPDYLLSVYQARIEGVEAKIRTLRDELSRTNVQSPARGRVLRLFEKSERVVEAGTPLLEVGDTSSIEIVVDVLSTDAVRIPPRATMEVDWGAGRTRTAKVRLIEPGGFTKVSALGVEEQRVNVVADFEDPPEGVGDGYRVEARIALWHSDDVLAVPVSALFRHGGEWAVFVVEEGRARRRTIRIGHMGAELVEVVEGLGEGEEVVLHPGSELGEGSTVEVASGR